MATNILDSGDTIPFVATANVVVGTLVRAGNMFGVAKISGVSGDVIPLETGVRCTLPKLNVASGSFAVGDYVYFDGTNCTVSATSNTKIGVATTAASNTATSVTVRLNESF